MLLGIIARPLAPLMPLPLLLQRAGVNDPSQEILPSTGNGVRLDRANGNHDNQVIWNSFTASGFVVDTTLEAQAFDLMDRWLSAIEADHSSNSLAQKVVANKPADAVDRCTVTGTGAPGPFPRRCIDGGNRRGWSSASVRASSHRER